MMHYAWQIFVLGFPVIGWSDIFLDIYILAILGQRNLEK